MIYLDNGATSFPKPQAVADAVAGALAAPASPGRSGHRPALAASRVVYRARKAVARLFGLPNPERVAFGPNVTWALNVAISGLGLGPGDEVISSGLEHNSVARPLGRLRDALGVAWRVVNPRGDGILHAEDFAGALSPRTRLAVVNHASNVSGALAPLAAIRAALPGVTLLLDAAQSAGAVPMGDVSSHADIVAFTGHKGLLGPTGTGGLWVREGVGLSPLAVGGSGSGSESLVHPAFMPDLLEAGTLNTHGLAGLAAGIGYILDRGVEDIRAHELRLSEILLEGLAGVPGLRVLGPGAGEGNRVATVSVALEGRSSSDVAGLLEEGHGIMVRSGLHCAPLAHEAYGTFPGGATRFSFGPFNTEGDAMAAVRALRGMAPRRLEAAGGA
jgi:cysteine desulfurase family protein